MKSFIALITMTILVSACAGSGSSGTTAAPGQSPGGQSSQTQTIAPSCSTVNSCANFCYNKFWNTNRQLFYQCDGSPANQLPWAGYTYVPGGN